VPNRLGCERWERNERQDSREKCLHRAGDRDCPGPLQEFDVTPWRHPNDPLRSCAPRLTPNGALELYVGCSSLAKSSPPEIRTALRSGLRVRAPGSRHARRPIVLADLFVRAPVMPAAIPPPGHSAPATPLIQGQIVCLTPSSVTAYPLHPSTYPPLL